MLHSDMAEILNTLPNDSRLRAAGALVRANRALSRQRKTDNELTDTLMRILQSPNPQSAKLRRLIRQIVSERE